MSRPWFTADERERFAKFHVNVQKFVRALCTEDNEVDDYIPGSQRIDFYETRLHAHHRIVIEDWQTRGKGVGEATYEDALRKRLLSQIDSELLILIGGLGSGKSTAVRNLLRRGDVPGTTILLDCLEYQSAKHPDTLHCHVLRGMRFSIYDLLLREWLEKNGVSDSFLNERFARVTLRRLLVANDLNEWALNARPSLIKLPRRGLSLGHRLLEVPIDAKRVDKLVSTYRDAADKHTDSYTEIDGNVDESVALTSLLCGFAASNEQIPIVPLVAVVDNLDQFPTEYIDGLSNHLFALTVPNEGVRILLPLRPSSISPTGRNTQNFSYGYHYGPNCFKMVLARLQKVLLCRSRRDLKSELLLNRESADEEVDCLLITGYLYALIMRAGVHRLDEDDLPLKDYRPEVHDDHAYLHRLVLSVPPLRSLAETTAALVGTSARYALEQLDRYFSYSYQCPAILSATVRGIGASRNPVQIGYSQAISALLGEWSAGRTRTRLVNLYRQPYAMEWADGEPLAASDWPSLTQIRLLSLLREQERVPVHVLVERLSRYAIPLEHTIAALNSLHTKHNLLVWFSRNTRLESDGESLRAYVTLSEHGLEYFRHVIGEFEYIWFCARAISGRSISYRQEDNFRSRLNDYIALMRRIGRVEWRQLAFWRFSRNARWDYSAYCADESLLTLRILYTSLERAFRSSSKALEKAVTSGYERDLRHLVSILLGLILDWQDRYRVCFGGNGYLSRYSSLLSALERPLDRLLGARRILGDDGWRLAHAVRESWREVRALTTADHPIVDLPAAAPSVDVGTRIAQLGRIVPGISKAVRALDGLVNAQEYTLAFCESHRRLGDLLSTSLPTYSLVDRELRALVRKGQRALVATESVASTLGELRPWLISEVDWLDDLHSRFKENEYTITHTVSVQEMADFASRFRNVASFVDDLAQRLCRRDVDHLRDALI